MKTRHLILGFIAMATSFTMQAQQFVANVDQTTLEWKGAKVSGDHNGYINLKSGEITIKDNKITDGLFIIDMTSITNEDFLLRIMGFCQ